MKKLKFTILGRHVATYVRICAFEGNFGRYSGHQTSEACRGLVERAVTRLIWHIGHM